MSTTVRVAGQPKSREKVVEKIAEERETTMRQDAQEQGREISRVLSDLASGRPPTTETVTAAIDRTDRILTREAQSNPILQQDAKARQTLMDTHEFLEASKNLLVHKTGDNKFQQFLVDSFRATSDLSGQSSELLSGSVSGAGGEEVPVREMRQHLAAVIHHSRKVLVELSTSKEFRDFVTLAGDIIARLLGIPVSFTGAGVKKASSSSSSTPAADTLSKIAATTQATQRTSSVSHEESESWVEEGPELDIEVHAARLAELELPPDYPTTLASGTRIISAEQSYAGVSGPAGQTFEVAEQQYTLRNEEPPPYLKVVEKHYVPGRASTTMSTSSETTTETEEADVARSKPAESTSNVMSAVQQMWLDNVDEEERKRLQADVYALLNKMSQNPDHKRAVESLFALGGLIWKTAPSAERMAGVQVPESVQKATQEGKAVLGAFTGGTQNIDTLVYHLRLFVRKVQGDPEVERVLTKSGKYFMRALDNPSIIQQAFFRQKVNQLLDRAGFLGERYANDPDLKEVLMSWKMIVTNITNDQDINAFGRALLKLRDDVTYIDDKGARRIDFDTLGRLRSVIFPLLVEQLHYIPLPPIVGDTPDVSYRLEDMVISFYDILPEHIFIDTETHTDLKPMSDYDHEYIDKTLEAGPHFHEEGELGTRKAYSRRHAWGYFKRKRAKAKSKSLRPRDKLAPHLTGDKATSTAGSSIVLAPDAHFRSTAQMVIRAYNIQFDIKNMKFDVLRKKFPKVHAKGLADVHTKGSKGCKIMLRLDMAMDAYQASPFTGAAIAAKIAPLKLKIHDSRHDIFYTMMSNMAAGTLRKKAEAAIVERLEGGVKRMLETLNSVFSSTLGNLPGLRITQPLAQPGPITSTAEAIAQH